MQNAKNITTIAILIAVTSSIATYAFTSQNDPSILIEKENKKAIRECLSAIDYESSSTEIQKAITACGKLEMKKIVGGNKLMNATGGIAPVPSQIKVSPESDSLESLHTRVCQKQVNSPLCKDKELFHRLYRITEERLPMKHFFPILLGITNAESSLWLNYAKDNIWWTCVWRNNLWGIKWRKTDDWKRVKDQQIPDKYGCYLYKFDSIDDYWISKVNTIRYGYKWCIDSSTPVRCLSFAYVGDPNIAEQSWIKNVSIFIN